MSDGKNTLLGIRFGVEKMSDAEARARFAELKRCYLFNDESEEIILLAERLDEQGDIWTFDFFTDEWKKGRGR